MESSKQYTRHNGRRYRMCVYPVLVEGGTGWGGFVESSRHYEGGTHAWPTRRQAMIEAARIVARVEAGRAAAEYAAIGTVGGAR
jgi:hypothetical protein